jgi:error-prone DNA polymerase
MWQAISLAGNRREAMWQAITGAPDKGLLRSAFVAEEDVTFAAPGEGEEIKADYKTLGLTLGRHLVALLRKTLAKMRFLPADVLNTFADRPLARGCGIVTVRQRPGTAKGVVFLTMEDETGPVNVIVWPDLAEK